LDKPVTKKQALSILKKYAQGSNQQLVA